MKPHPIALQLAGLATIFAIITFGGGIGWTWTLLLIAAVMIHESGHWLGAKLCGAPTSGPVILPIGMMVPVAATPRQLPFVLLAGPAVGLMPAGLAGLLYLATGDARCAGFAGFVGLLNLLNLAPIGPTDGGRLITSVLTSITPLLGLAWLALGCGVFLAAGFIKWELFILAAFIVWLSWSQLHYLFVEANIEYGIVRRLARAYGTPGHDERALLAARSESFGLAIFAEAQGRPVERSPGDQLWDAMDESLARDGRLSLREFLEERQRRAPGLTRFAAAGWLAAYALLMALCVWTITAADAVMSLRELYGVALHG